MILPPLPGRLALGASVVELAAPSAEFAMCARLLAGQPPFATRRGIGLSILRVMQCRSHLHGLDTISPLVHTIESPKAHHKLPQSAVPGWSRGEPSLAFVVGDLGALSNFVRSGLRLIGGSELPRRTNGLIVTQSLNERDCWGSKTGLVQGGGEHATKSDASSPALAVWRLVLAICWPDGASAHGQATASRLVEPNSQSAAATTASPAFIIDYAVESMEAQLGFRQLAIP